MLQPLLSTRCQSSIRQRRQYAESQNKLSVKLAEANGAPKNMLEALKWFSISAAAGNEKAVDNRDKAEKAMKPVDVKKAQALAVAWMKKNKPD